MLAHFLLFISGHWFKQHAATHLWESTSFRFHEGTLRKATSEIGHFIESVVQYAPFGYLFIKNVRLATSQWRVAAMSC